MSYEDEIKKLQMRPRAELYIIEIENDQTLHLTSYEKDITYLGIKYSARPIKRDSHKQEKQVDTESIQVHIPITPFVIEFLVDGYLPNITVTILDYFVDTNFVANKFGGRVIDVTTNFGVKDSTAILEVENGGDDLRNVFPGQAVNSACPFELFDVNCGLVRADFVITTTVTVASPTSLESGVFALEADGYFKEGVVKFGLLRSWITNHVGNTITLHRPIAGLESGNQVEVTPGDDKKRTTCRDKFNNESKWGGFSDVPLKNQVTEGL